MADVNDLRRGRHCVTALHVHLVFVTKYRNDVFTPPALLRLKEIFSKVCSDFGAVLVESNGEADQVHLLVEYQSKTSVAALVNSLKGVSSRLLRSEIPMLADRYYKGVLWSPSYFAASCGGAPLSILQQYIDNQKINGTPLSKPGVR